MKVPCKCGAVDGRDGMRPIKPSLLRNTPSLQNASSSQDVPYSQDERWIEQAGLWY